MLPVFVAHRREVDIDLAQIFLGFLNGGKFGAAPDVLANADYGVALDLGPDVIEDQPPDRGMGKGCKNHADNSTHRGSHPVDFGLIDPCQQRVHVSVVLQVVIALGRREMVAFSASDHVRADDPVAIAHFLGEKIEVAGVAGDPVNADDGFLAAGPVGTAPFEVIYPMEAVETQTVEIVLRISFYRRCNLV